MLVIAFLISFVVAYISLYIVSFFSGEGSNPIAVLKVTGILWGLSIIVATFHITGILAMIIYTIVSMISFMNFLGFEATPAFFAGLLYSVINYFLLILIFSSIM